MNNKLQWKGTWNELKGKLAQKFTQMKNDDLSFLESKEEELYKRLQKRLARKKQIANG